MSESSPRTKSGDCVLQLGDDVGIKVCEILEQWKSFIERKLPSNARTTHRPQLIDAVAHLLTSSFNNHLNKDGNPKKSDTVHLSLAWQKGWELELVINDLNALYPAIRAVADKHDLQKPNLQIQRVLDVINTGCIGAIRSFVAYRTQNERKIPTLSGILECCTDAIIELSLDGTILNWNQGATRLYGYLANEIVGSHIGTILPVDRQIEFDRCIAVLRSGRDVSPFDTVRRRADGTEIPVSITASPIRDGQGKLEGFVSIARDISDRVRAAEALRDALEEAERASRAKSEFLANVSHELRTPMNAIIGMTELALDEELSPELRDYLETTRESADLLLALVNDVLDISKLESGKFVLDEVDFSLRELVDETVRSISSRAYRKGLEIVCLVSSDVPDAVHGDPLRLRQILTNLVGNAIKFTDDGEVVVEVTLESSSGRSCILRFSVADTGIGISNEDQTRVFAPFTQADASSTRRHTGTGLGLAIAGHLINCFRGQLWLQSEVGVGSTFYFTTRLTLADENETHSNSSSLNTNQFKDLRILVVDDNETNRDIVANQLSEWQISPVLAHDARTAMKEIDTAASQGHPISLAIVDAIMPERDGFELIKEIQQKAKNKTKTVLMISSADRITFKDRCHELEFDSLLEKPVSQTNLLKSLASVFGIVAPPSITRVNGLSETRSPQRHLHLLLAEDTPANRKVVEKVLTKRGHSVTSVSNGREAVDEFRQGGFDAVLMDVQMPSMDGLQATESIRKCEDERGNKNRIPIIAMTAHAMVGDRHRCLAAGMDDYISKPINIRRLIDLVEHYGDRNLHIDQIEKTQSAPNQKISAYHTAEEGDIMDLERALRRLDNDKALLIDLIGFFLEDYPALITRIDESLQNDDASSLQRASHSLKGLVANFDAHVSKDICQQIETFAKQGDMATAASLVDGMKQSIEELARELQNYRDGSN